MAELRDPSDRLSKRAARLAGRLKELWHRNTSVSIRSSTHAVHTRLLFLGLDHTT